jgi:membrane protein required for beta-lactamase induction
MSDPVDPGVPRPDGPPAPRRWLAPKGSGVGRRQVGLQAYLVAGGVIVLALVVFTLARQGLSPVLFGIIPLVLVLAIGILVKR